MVTLVDGYAPLLIRAGATPALLCTHAYRSHQKGSHDLGDNAEFTQRLQEGTAVCANALRAALPPEHKPRVAPLGAVGSCRRLASLPSVPFVSPFYASGAAMKAVHDERPELWRCAPHRAPSTLRRAGPVKAGVAFRLGLCSVANPHPTIPLAAKSSSRPAHRRLFHTDDFHLSPTGSYLCAAVIYATVFGEPPPPPPATDAAVAALFHRARRMQPEGEAPLPLPSREVPMPGTRPSLPPSLPLALSPSRPRPFVSAKKLHIPRCCAGRAES